MIIQITASLSSNTYNKASWPRGLDIWGNRINILHHMIFPWDFWFLLTSTGRPVLSEIWDTLPKTETIRSHNSNYGLRVSFEYIFLVIRSNFSYRSPRSFIKSPWSIVRRSFSFPLLRRPSTVLIQFWVTCWREAFHELPHGSDDQSLQINLYLYQVTLICLLLQLISMDLDFLNVSSPGLLKLRTIRRRPGNKNSS